jgi:hypothetical protein
MLDREDHPGGAAPRIRSMEITPPSGRREAANVLRVAAVILIVTWVYLADRAVPRARNAAGVSGAGTDLAPFQKLFPDLDPRGQRMFRALHEGLLEAENIRSATGTWPTTAVLAQGGIPPFAADPIADREKYAWTFRHEGIFVNYLGRPAAPGLPAFLLLIQEPTPGAPPDRTPNDEQHHRLTNGDVLHVSVWTHTDGAKIADGILSLPQTSGWTQLLAGSPTPAPP